jgi:hypothetical protein
MIALFCANGFLDLLRVRIMARVPGSLLGGNQQA